MEVASKKQIVGFYWGVDPSIWCVVIIRIYKYTTNKIWCQEKKEYIFFVVADSLP